ncbi:MAG: hypothetical protein QM728_10385 [Gordonia sp. (in: high G+C Gram-positive bacteria)]|uniref:hypothetical protein n=1 Tax=Gordonia sp. (in: high G+C Gram-positive bacteria) TaxID=84139 RepID=UPI0039E50C3E
MLISALDRRRLGVPTDRAVLRFNDFERLDEVARTNSHELLLEGKAAFELSFWCGTCPFLFRRKWGSYKTLSDDVATLAELEQPISEVDDKVFDTFGQLIAEGEYLPLLLEVRPTLVTPGDERDYFAHEQVATWGLDPFWLLPQNPQSFYYRTFETKVDDDAHLYEFVVPMVPPALNERDRVQHYVELMRDGITPTAVALSNLEVRAPATSWPDDDSYWHWCLTHFLLDGHHKLEAAATTGEPVQILALVSVADSRGEARRDLDRLPELLTRRQVARRPGE